MPPKCPLAPRQLAVLLLLAKGFSRREIAERLGITPSTVRTHTSRIYKILGVHSAGQAVAVAADAGWLWIVDIEPPELPLSATHPWLHVYLAEFDRWLASGFQDGAARERMCLALRGARSSPQNRRSSSG